MKHPWEYNYKQGDIVDFDLNGQLTGIGEVVGAASAVTSIRRFSSRRPISEYGRAT